ncbi:Nucleoporin p58/p45 [Echinococcus granulosus]|nr:Nucleoporin p58/p45 [Echinococcus granulosus]
MGCTDFRSSLFLFRDNKPKLVKLKRCFLETEFLGEHLFDIIGKIRSSSAIYAMSLSATFTGLLDSKAQKDTQVSPEILKLVEDLKKYFADQRRQRDEIINISNKSFDDLLSELSELQRSVTCILSELRRQSVKSSHMSDEVLKLERNSSIIQQSLDMTCDFAQNTSELTEYFKNCISSFGHRVQTYKQQVEAIEGSLSSHAKASLTPKELADVLRTLDDQFMSLAAQLYTLNEELSLSKTQLLRQRRNPDVKTAFFDSPSTNNSMSPFDKFLFDSERTSVATPYGPPPFTTTVSLASPSGVTATTGLPLATGSALQPPTTTTTTASSFFSALKPVATSGPFTFGSAAPPTTTTSTSGFTLGAFGSAPTATTTPATGFSFGLPTASTGTSGTGFGFGAASAAALPATATTTAGSFGFGATTGGSIFGSPAVTRPSLFAAK